MTAVPDDLIERPVRSIAEQATAGPEPKKPRANAAQPIPSTGLEPRTVTEAALPPPPEDEPADPVETVNEDEAHWVELYKLLAYEPEATETKPVLEGRLRNLYHYMDVLDALTSVCFADDSQITRMVVVKTWAEKTPGVNVGVWDETLEAWNLDSALAQGAQ